MVTAVFALPRSSTVVVQNPHLVARWPLCYLPRVSLIIAGCHSLFTAMHSIASVAALPAFIALRPSTRTMRCALPAMPSSSNAPVCRLPKISLPPVTVFLCKKTAWWLITHEGLLSAGRSLLFALTMVAVTSLQGRPSAERAFSRDISLLSCAFAEGPSDLNMPPVICVRLTLRAAGAPSILAVSRLTGL